MLTRKRSELALKPYFKDNIFETTEEAYLNAKGWIGGIIHQLQTSVSAQTAGGTPLLSGATASQSIQSSYERLPLPRFDGKQRNWETFKQKFVSMIINDTAISPILKLQRLLSCLDGEAAELVKGTQHIGSNFETVWNTLMRCFDNKHVRMSMQMQALLREPAC